ncbi:MAG: F0F1 ATP synthase subunit A [Candidatus Eisenbacteria bacterium]
MGPDFLARSLRATAYLTCLVAGVAAAYLGLRFGLAVAAGSAWSLVNLLLLGALVRQLGYRGKAGEPLRALLVLGLKGPLLYGAGYLLLRAGLPPAGLVGGFGLVFLVVVAKALGQGMKTPKLRARAAGILLVAFAAGALLASGVHAKEAARHVQTPAAAGTAAAPTEAAHAEAGREAAGHEEGGHEEGAPEMPNLVTYLRAAYAGQAEPNWVKFLHEWENVFFSLLAAALLVAIFGTAARAKALVPHGMQNAAEALLGGLHDFFLGILGPTGKPYIPFIGSLFLYIVTMNWMGMVPFLKSPNASLNTTLALAICVFFYVQYIGITRNGLGGYLYHFAGQPKDAIGWGSAVLLFPLEVMGEFIKPISLSCRLFGNILGEDILLAVFVGLGVTALSAVHSPIGIPFQLPFLLLSSLFGLIQGLVFSLLTTVYIVMMLPHDDHHEHHEAHAGDAHATAHP